MNWIKKIIDKIGKGIGVTHYELLQNEIDALAQRVLALENVTHDHVIVATRATIITGTPTMKVK